MTFPISYEDFVYALSRWKNGVLIQDAFPTLSAEEREFIMTGVTPEEWNNVFGPVKEL